MISPMSAYIAHQPCVFEYALAKMATTSTREVRRQGISVYQVYVSSKCRFKSYPHIYMVEKRSVVL